MFGGALLGDERALAASLPRAPSDEGRGNSEQHPRATVNLSLSDPGRSDHSSVLSAVKIDDWWLLVETSIVNGISVGDAQSDNMTHDAIPFAGVEVLTILLHDDEIYRRLSSILLINHLVVNTS